jgi:hypothetical protein
MEGWKNNTLHENKRMYFMMQKMQNLCAKWDTKGSFENGSELVEEVSRNVYLKYYYGIWLKRMM